MAGEVERSVKRIDDGLAQGEGSRRVFGMKLDDGKFVAAEPGNGIDIGDQTGQPLGHLAQQLIARSMTQRVVDPLEVVEVDIMQRHSSHAAAGIGERLLQPVLEQCPIWQARHRIVEGQEGGLSLGDFELAGRALEPPQQDIDGQAADEQPAGHDRQSFLDQVIGRFLGYPGEEADNASGIAEDGRGDPLLVGGGQALESEARNFVATADLISHRGVDNPHGNVQMLGARGLGHGAGCRNDRPHADNGRLSVPEQHDILHAQAGYCLGRIRQPCRCPRHLGADLGHQRGNGGGIPFIGGILDMDALHHRTHRPVIGIEQIDAVVAEILAHPLAKIVGEPSLVVGTDIEGGFVPDDGAILLDRDTLLDVVETALHGPRLAGDRAIVDAGRRPPAERAEDCDQHRRECEGEVTDLAGQRRWSGRQDAPAGIDDGAIRMIGKP